MTPRKIVPVLPLKQGDRRTLAPTVKDGFALFWGGWASNWAPSMFTVDGQSYSCVEQFFMAEKARVFGDEETRQKILKARYPKAQKELGRQVRGFKETVWTKRRFKTMSRGVLEKFRQDSELQKRLCAIPAGVRFVEASPEDDLWGIGVSASDPRATQPSKWPGQNLLGKALDAARAKVCRR